jgi:hypothetical protein
MIEGQVVMESTRRIFVQERISGSSFSEWHNLERHSGTF